MELTIWLHCSQYTTFAKTGHYVPDLNEADHEKSVWICMGKSDVVGSHNETLALSLASIL